jgi:hypothetical protein
LTVTLDETIKEFYNGRTLRAFSGGAASGWAVENATVFDEARARLKMITLGPF